MKLKIWLPVLITILAVAGATGCSVNPENSNINIEPIPLYYTMDKSENYQIVSAAKWNIEDGTLAFDSNQILGNAYGCMKENKIALYGNKEIIIGNLPCPDGSQKIEILDNSYKVETINIPGSGGRYKIS